MRIHLSREFPVPALKYFFIARSYSNCFMKRKATSLQEIWKERLRRARGVSLAGKRAFSAFNIVVDLVKFVSGKSVSQKIAQMKGESNGFPKRVDSPPSFLSALAFSMREGKSSHFVCENPEVFGWVESEFAPPGQTRLGGQAGIIANQVALLGADSVLYSPFFAPVHAALFHKKVLVPFCGKCGAARLIPARNAGRPGDPTKKNWIFEFKKGDKVRVGGKAFKIPRSNRFILASPMPVVPAFDNCTRKFLPQIGKNVDAAFFAGFHYLTPIDGRGTSFRKVLAQQDADVKLLRKKNSKLLVHVEYVPMAHKEIERAVLAHVAREVDSLGINEIEIAEALEKTGFKKEAKAVRENESSATLFEGAKKLLFSLKLKRLHVHNLGYQMVILKKPPISSPEKVRQGLLFASLCATAKAVLGREFSKKELSAAFKIPLSQRGFRQMQLLARHLRENYPCFDAEEFLREGFFDEGSFVLVVAPMQVAENPKSTVGIGDVVSSSSLLAEL